MLVSADRRRTSFHLRPLATILAVSAILAACDTGRGAGEKCAKPTDCAQGLTCVPVSVEAEGGTTAGAPASVKMDMRCVDPANAFGSTEAPQELIGTWVLDLESMLAQANLSDEQRKAAAADLATSNSELTLTFTKNGQITWKGTGTNEAMSEEGSYRVKSSDDNRLVLEVVSEKGARNTIDVVLEDDELTLSRQGQPVDMSFKRRDRAG